MMWPYFEEMLRITQSAFAQQQVERSPYTGPLRWRGDAIEVEARVVGEIEPEEDRA